ncbi:unnamed protein product [Peronospora destructor]|uniref:1-phosphatidylinositol 4-kinase n=1 Tax=Peronospora destructor TaxID=86335 RepID=A0AAV0V5K9_9STRA|nr:unnamed protein product [Peronospora destructor]
MDRLAGNRVKTDVAQEDVFHLLLKLYAHQDVLEELYNSYDKNAAEFVFYIPQLCTFLMHGNYAKQHQLECFLMSRSGESLPFAHRLTWFLRSFCDNARGYHSEYLSVTAPQGEENSDFINALGRRAGVPALLMNSGLCVEEVSATKPDNLERRRWMIFPTDDEQEFARLESDESFAGHLLRRRNSVQDEARTDEGNAHQISLFKQTPTFVEALTDLAEELIPIPRSQRNRELRKRLRCIDMQMLPSDVIYLPIGNPYHRVKRIWTEECFTFSTKERVPYFLCVEVLDYSVATSPAASKKKQKKRKPKASRNHQMREVEDERCPTSSSLSTPLREVDDVLDLIEDRMNGEDGDDEKEGKPEIRKSFQKDKNLQRAEEKQQERLGQWNLPRSQRRSIKEYSNSASARLGGQFDSFYSSWFSKKALHDAEEDEHAPPVFDQTTVDGTAGKVVASPSIKNEEPAVIKEVVAGAGDEGVEACDLHEAVSAQSTSLEDEAVVASATGENLTAPLCEKAKLGVTAQESEASSNESKALSKPNENGASIGFEPIESDAWKAMPTQKLIPALFKRKTTAANDRKDNAADGIFEFMFAKKSQVCLLESSKVGISDEFDAEDANDEESESKKVLPSENNSADRTSVSLEDGSMTDDSVAEDADGEDTDSSGGYILDDDEFVCEPEPSPVNEAFEKQDPIVSGLFQKSVTELTEQIPANLDGATACTNGEIALSENVDPDVSSLTLSAPDVESKTVSEDEGPLRQRRRDLSVSLDFADPTAWKEEFDLDDGLTDDEPDVEVVDDKSVDDDAEEEHEASEDEDEKPMIVFRERWSEKEARIRNESPYGVHPGWRLLSVIVKSNDDLRQEQFAAQLIAQCDRIFREYSLPLSLRPYNVIATSAKTGLIEAVPDTVSLDSLKRNDPGYTTLQDFYIRLHGDKGTAEFTRAQRNFVESLAAYSIVCYVLQIKDRHNGNILVNTDGHVIHIDFGFLLTNSPGSNWNFERAPFKLTDEFVELMGGPRSSTFRYFRSLCIRAYLALRRNMSQIVLLVEMMLVGNADLPCFAGGKKAVIEGLRARLKPGARTSTCQVFVNQLIDQSINNWRTRWYDKYQRTCLGIL